MFYWYFSAVFTVEIIHSLFGSNISCKYHHGGCPLQLQLNQAPFPIKILWSDSKFDEYCHWYSFNKKKMIWLQRNLAHTTTAQLSWNVQNLLWSTDVREKMSKFPLNLKIRQKFHVIRQASMVVAQLLSWNPFTQWTAWKKEALTYWSLGDLGVTLKIQFSGLLYWLVPSEHLLIRSMRSSDEWYRTSLMIIQHCFR